MYIYLKANNVETTIAAKNVFVHRGYDNTGTFDRLSYVWKIIIHHSVHLLIQKWNPLKTL